MKQSPMLAIILLLFSHTIQVNSSMYENESRYLRDKNVDNKISHEVEEALHNVPDWLKEYINWHEDQRHRHDSPTIKYLTVACHSPGFCGGISDRLRPLPYFLLFAHKTNRVLLIKWQKFQLEDFLVPPHGGLDWRLPDGMDIGTEPDATTLDLASILTDPKHELHKKKNLVVRANRDMYGSVKDEFFVTQNKPLGTFGDVWKVLFEPVPELKKLISKTMADLKLSPKKYVSAHYRGKDFSFHSKHTAAEEQNKRWHSQLEQSPRIDIENTLACAHMQNEKYKDFPIYFTASDTNDVKYALGHSFYAKKNRTVKLIGLDQVVRFHSDKPARDHTFHNGHKGIDPHHLFPAFLDLYLLANSACVSYGKLGFGKLGAYISGEECMVNSLHKKCFDE